MLTAYIQAAMRHAHYEVVEDAKPHYGEIPACAGVWAAGQTLEDWIVLGLRMGHPIAHIDETSIAPANLEPVHV